MATKVYGTGLMVFVDAGAGITRIAQSQADYKIDANDVITIFDRSGQFRQKIQLADLQNKAGAPQGGTVDAADTYLSGFIGGFNSPRVGGHYAEYHLTTTPESILLNDDGVTYSKIPNMVLNVGKGFEVTTGTLKKIEAGSVFLINGTSDIEVDKAAEISYALVVNGTPVPSEITHHTFTSSAKIQNISITSIATINLDDEIEIHVKGDGTPAVTITVTKLDVTFLKIDD